MAKQMIASQVDDSEWQIIEEQEYRLIGEAYQESYAHLFQAAPLLLEACQEWVALDEVTKECADCEAVEFGLCWNHYSQMGKILKMRNAAIKAALGG